jgi:hypothetical protein
MCILLKIGGKVAEFTLMTESEVLEMYSKAKKDLEIKSTDLFASLIEQLGKHSDWLRIYMREKGKLKKLQQLAKKRWSKLFFAYRFDERKLNKDGVLLTQAKEIENAVLQDEDWIKTQSMLDHQELVVEFLKSVLDLFGDRKWLIKDCIETMKLDRDSV